MIEKSFCNIVILQPLLDLEASDFKSVEEQQLEEAQSRQKQLRLNLKKPKSRQDGA